MEIALLIENIKRENETFLAAFQTYLENYGVSEKVMQVYISNAEMYLNDYLAEECHKHMTSGIREMDGFFREYFIHCMLYPSEERMERILKSLRMFYRCMHDYKFIDQKQYAFLEWIIKQSKQEWLDCFNEWNKMEEEMAREAFGE